QEPSLSGTARASDTRAPRPGRMDEAVLRWPGNFLHFLFLLIVTIIAAVIYGIARLGIALFIWGPRRARALGTLRGWMLKQVMQTLGATFIKMGQVMSTRPDLFAP